MAVPHGTVVAVTGFTWERRIIARGGGEVVSGIGDDPTALSLALERAALAGARAFISIGIGGGLSPALDCGRIVIGTAVIASDGRHVTDPKWSSNLGRLLPDATAGDIAAGGVPMVSTAQKVRLYRQNGAVAADMESHTVARVAARYGLPFAVVRVIADTADDGLPPAAVAGMGPGGRIRLGAVISSVARTPGQLPDLIRVARGTRRALVVLLGCGRALGADFGFPNLGELQLDMR